MESESIIIDSSVLIRWVQKADPRYSIVRAALQQVEDLRMIPCCTSQNIEEFWSVLTRPADRNGYGMPAEAVLMRVRSLESKFRLLPELPSVHPTWRRLLLVHGVTGSHVRDAHLAASMIVHGVRRILTFNTKEFSRFSAVQPLHPRDFVRASQQ